MISARSSDGDKIQPREYGLRIPASLKICVIRGCLRLIVGEMPGDLPLIWLWHSPLHHWSPACLPA